MKSARPAGIASTSANLMVGAVAVGAGLAIGGGHAIILFLLGGIFVFLGTLANPFWGVCLILFMVPIEEGVILESDITALKVLAVVVLMGWFFEWATGRRKIVVPKPLVLAAVLFIGIGFTSILWAEDAEVALIRWFSLTLLVGLAFLLLQELDSVRRLRIAVLANLGGAVVASALTFLNFQQFGDRSASGRFAAFLGESAGGEVQAVGAGTFPVLLGLGFSYSLLTALSLRGIYRVLWGSLAGTLVLAALLSGTRGFVIAALGALLVVLVMGRRWLRLNDKLALVVVLLFSAVAAVRVLPAELVERVSSSPVALFDVDDQASGRVDIWKAYLVMIADHPFTGVGIGNGPVVYEEARAESVSRGWGSTHTARPTLNDPLRDAHSSYLSVWAELGTLAFVVFLLALFSLVRGFVRRLRSALPGSGFWLLGLALFMNLSVVLIDSLVHTSVTKKVFWAALGLSLAWCELSRRRVHKRDDVRLAPEVPPSSHLVVSRPSR